MLMSALYHRRQPNPFVIDYATKVQQALNYRIIRSGNELIGVIETTIIEVEVQDKLLKMFEVNQFFISSIVLKRV